MARILHGVEAPPRASDHLLPTMTLYEMRATRIGLTVHPSSRLPDRASGLYPLELGDAFELFEQFGSGLITIFRAFGEHLENNAFELVGDGELIFFGLFGFGLANLADGVGQRIFRATSRFSLVSRAL